MATVNGRSSLRVMSSNIFSIWSRNASTRCVSVSDTLENSADGASAWGRNSFILIISPHYLISFCHSERASKQTRFNFNGAGIVCLIAIHFCHDESTTVETKCLIF